MKAVIKIKKNFIVIPPLSLNCSAVQTSPARGEVKLFPRRVTRTKIEVVLVEVSFTSPLAGEVDSEGVGRGGINLNI